MSGSTPGSAPKSMSSRLLTMKFMQRAAASTPTTPTTPTPEEPSPKRRKKNSDARSPSTKFDVNALANQSAIEAAVAIEEARNEAALERAAQESGDTRWVLSFEDQQVASSSLALRIVETGYANLDAHRVMVNHTEVNAPMMVGRRSFGKFNKVLEKSQNGEDESESSSDDEDDKESERDSDDDPASQMIRASRIEAVARAKAERKQRKRAEKAAASEKMAKKKKKTVNLNELTSLSGRAQAPPSGIVCFRCSGPHLKKDCPQPPKRGYYGDDDGPARKVIKSR